MNPTKVEISGMAFNPPTLTVCVGQCVTWTNCDDMTHTVTDDGGPGPKALVDSGDIAPGASYDITFLTAGTFPYHCSYHSHMKGVVVVS